ncbi:MAG: aminoacetone oxidase family FAD-binding enzyme [Oscillospiraceae bacterium]|nr:aminoacetone oxidase family FAD-binding enzyme [Oscillospiraceae bacterium]
MKVLILGGGAAGMAAAIEAASNGHSVTVLERQSRVGRKLIATGNGRCNLSNRFAAPDRYHGDDRFIRTVLDRFPVDDTLAWFHKFGLYTVEEPDGRYYPLSDHAGSVVDTLRFALDRLGVQVVCGCEVTAIAKKARGWQMTAADGSTYYGDRAIIAAGGCAGAALGGTKSGYTLFGSLGHTVTKLAPSLVQIKTDNTLTRALKGVRADCALTLKTPHGVLAQSAGEVQFTDFGVSGPAAFDLSRAVSTTDENLTLLLNFLRSTDEETLTAELQNRASAFPDLTADQLLTGMLHPRLALAVLKAAQIAPDAPADDETAARVAHTIRYFPLTVTGTLGMDHAQVTAGGVATSEFRADTLESRLAPGVFAAGEVLDVDGDCGGFNLQWAWASGRLAGLLGERGDGK